MTAYRAVSLGGRVITQAEPVVAGPVGRSAYQLAVDNGFAGTPAEWLDSLHEVDWDDVDDKPDFAPVATSGSYTDLDDKPAIPSIAGLASTGYVDTAVSGEAVARAAAISQAIVDLVGAAPAELDEWAEIVAGIQSDATGLAAVVAALTGKQDASATLALLSVLSTTTIGRSLLTAPDAAALRAALVLATVAASGSAGDLSETSTAKVLTGAERTKLAGVATGATANDTDANLRDRASHTGQQTSASISDFAEAAQDAVAAALAGTSGATVTYDDTANTITITGIGDPETMRDTIGTALVGVGNITVVVDDAGNTITISTTATVNSTDAALRDRSTHTGNQLAATISDLTEAVQDIVGALIAAGTGISVTYNDAGNVETITVTNPYTPPGSWQALTMNGGGSTTPSGCDAPAARLEGDLVRFRGAYFGATLSAGSYNGTTGAFTPPATPLCTLPAGLRPAARRPIRGIGSNASATPPFIVETNGQVWTTAAIASTALINLDGATFTL